MSVPTFTQLTELARSGSAPVPADWKQGRTAYGGLTAALMLAQTRAAHEDLPPLRSALINFTGPVTEDPQLRCEVLRAGRNVTTVAARASQESGVVGTATFSFGAARESHIRQDLPAPEADAPEHYEPLIPEAATQFAPGFTVNFETRLIEGDRPMMGSERGYLRCWARHRDAAAHDTETGLLGLADILPPAALPMFRQFGPVSSMTWICNFLRAPGTTDGWYMVEADLTAALDGYSSQVMRIWNAKGELVVEGMQSIVIFA